MSEELSHAELLKKKEEHYLKHGKDVPWVICPWNDPEPDMYGCTSYIKDYAKKDPDFKKKYIEEERKSILRLNAQKEEIWYPGQQLQVCTVNVYVHVLFSNPTTRCTDQQIQDAIAYTNQVYAQSCQYCLNGGVRGLWGAEQSNSYVQIAWDPANRSNVSTSQTFAFGNYVKEASSGGSDAVGLGESGSADDIYCNWWICDLEGGLLGFGTFPWMTNHIQGIVTDYDCFAAPLGTNPKYQDGQVIPHEFGHYFNLRHVWGDGDCTADDFCADTPMASGAARTCVPPDRDTCPNLPGLDMVENIMDYNPGHCSGIITHDQTARIRDCLTQFRPGLGGCTGAPPITTAPPPAGTTTTYPGQTTPPPSVTTPPPSGTTPPPGVTTSTTAWTGPGPPPLIGDICIKTKGVTVKKAYIGENLILKNIITTDLEIFFVEASNTETINRWLLEIQKYFELGRLIYDLDIAGQIFGPLIGSTGCRILKADFPTGPAASENAIKRGVYRITIEEITPFGKGSFTNYPLETDLIGQITADWLDDITEDISYSIGLNNQYSVSHTVSIVPNVARFKWQDTTQAAAIAKNILDSWRVPDNWEVSNSSIHRLFRDAAVEGQVSSSVNQITGEVSWTRNINTLANAPTEGQWTSSYHQEEHAHNINLNKEGFITVTESGTLKPLPHVTFADILQDGVSVDKLLEDHLWDNVAPKTTCRDRCNEIFLHYVDYLDGSIPDSTNRPVDPLIIDLPLSNVRTFNSVSQEVSYTVSFTNDPKLSSDGLLVDRAVSLDQNEVGVVTITEKNNMTQVGNRGMPSQGARPIPDILNWYLQDIPDANTRIGEYWANAPDIYAPDKSLEGQVNTFIFNEIKRKINYGPKSKSINYSVIYTSDRSIMSPESPAGLVGIKKLESKISDKVPHQMRKEFPIAGWKMLVHNPHQSNLGSRTVSFTATLSRQPGYFLNTGPNKYSKPPILEATIDHLADLARTELLNVFVPGSGPPGLVPDDIYVTDCTWTINSQRMLTLTATAQYAQAAMD